MKDTLHFTVAPGTYPNGVEVSVHGIVDGTATGSFGPNSSFSYQFVLQSTQTSDQFFGPTSFSRPFTLTHKIIADGTTLNESTEVSAPLWSTLSIGIEATGGSHIVVDMYSTGRYTGVTTPAGISSWYAESGSPLPEPATLGLLTIGALALRRRPRCHPTLQNCGDSRRALTEATGTDDHSPRASHHIARHSRTTDGHWRPSAANAEAGNPLSRNHRAESTQALAVPIEKRRVSSSVNGDPRRVSKRGGRESNPQPPDRQSGALTN